MCQQRHQQETAVSEPLSAVLLIFLHLPKFLGLLKGFCSLKIRLLRLFYEQCTIAGYGCLGCTLDLCVGQGSWHAQYAKPMCLNTLCR